MKEEPTIGQQERDLSRAVAMHKHLHITMQGKGGIGKTVVASLLSEILGADAADFDLQTQSGLQRFNDLHPHVVPIGVGMDKESQVSGDEFDNSVFEKYMDVVIRSEGQHHVWDFGAHSFLALKTYLEAMKPWEFLSELKPAPVHIWVHLLVCGGNLQTPTAEEAIKLVAIFGTQVNFVLWENPWNEPIINENGEEGLSTLRYYATHLSPTAGRGVVGHIKMLDRRDPMGKLVARSYKNGKTLGEAQDDVDEALMSRHGYAKAYNFYRSQLDLIFLPEALQKRFGSKSGVSRKSTDDLMRQIAAAKNEAAAIGEAQSQAEPEEQGEDIRQEETEALSNLKVEQVDDDPDVYLDTRLAEEVPTDPDEISAMLQENEEENAEAS